MAHLESSLLLFAIAFVNITFGQNATAALPDKQFEIRYFSKASWYNAHWSCMECGGQLASIESQEEQNYVEGLIKDLGLQSSNFWIAGSDIANEGIFNWFTTGAPIRYANFEKGEPNNAAGKEHCLALWGEAAAKLTWYDANCLNSYFFICDKRPKC